MEAAFQVAKVASGTGKKILTDWLTRLPDVWGRFWERLVWNSVGRSDDDVDEAEVKELLEEEEEENELRRRRRKECRTSIRYRLFLILLSRFKICFSRCWLPFFGLWQCYTVSITTNTRFFSFLGTSICSFLLLLLFLCIAISIRVLKINSWRFPPICSFLFFFVVVSLHRNLSSCSSNQSATISFNLQFSCCCCFASQSLSLSLSVFF
jgi:hypothetical protein